MTSRVEEGGAEGCGASLMASTLDGGGAGGDDGSAMTSTLEGGGGGGGGGSGGGAGGVWSEDDIKHHYTGPREHDGCASDRPLIEPVTSPKVI